MSTEEKTIWRGSSSPIVHFGFFVLCGTVSAALIALSLVLAYRGVSVWPLVSTAAALVPLVAAAVKLVVNQCRVYEVTTQRIRLDTGVFSKVSQELELYRVKDLAVVRPFLYRMFGRSNIVMTTNDVSSPTVVLEAVPAVESLREQLRQSVEICRDQKRVRLAELE